jgi:hypothetical protein
MFLKKSNKFFMKIHIHACIIIIVFKNSVHIMYVIVLKKKNI